MQKFKNFKFKEIFDHIAQGKRLKISDHISGDIPFVMAGYINNGICDYISNQEARRFPANSITIDIFGNCFYRKYEFAAGDDVGVFWSDKDISNKAMTYICAVIGKSLSGKFGFGNKLRASQTYDFEILLPSKDEQIDFEFMDNYIKNIEIKMRTLISSYSLLTAASRERERENKPRSDFSLIFSKNSHISSLIKEAIIQMAKSLFGKLGVKWGEFRLVDLFDYERGSRLTKNNRKSGIYPLITAGETNLGVKEFISNKNQKIFNNAITIDMFCNSFVHIKDFCCDDNVLVLTSKTKVSTEVMHFISAIIHKSKDKFGYGQQYRQNTLEKHVIYLPLDEFSNPNFTLMENFIKEIKQNHTQKLIDYYLRLADIAE